MKRIAILLIWIACLMGGGFNAPLGYTQETDTADENHTFKLNFRGADLETVLDYLSRAAGFVVIKQTEITGKVDVWSHQPLSKDEAVNLLNTVLHEKGYAVVRNDRILTIVTRDEAKKKDIPVKTGNRPELIPKTDEMVTQIVPVRYTNAVQLIENLQPLLPSYANMTANESSNAVVITDTQSNVRRMVQIIEALDTSISGISTVRVFQLQYTDAADMATIITDLFAVPESTNRNQGRFGGFPGFGGQGGRGGGRGGNEEQTDSEARRAVSRVVAVADQNTNSLIVTAAEDIMPLIENIIAEVDVPVQDMTEIRVFHLKHADATELAEQIQELFPDETSSTTNQFAPRFGRGGFFGGPQGPGGGANTQQQTSERKLKQTSVRCVADPRTNSIVVMAAQETMIQISEMIFQIDSDPARKQKVFVYQLEYADVDNLAEILRNIFEGQFNPINRTNTTTNQGSSLSNRTGASSIDTSFIQSQTGSGGFQP